MKLTQSDEEMINGSQEVDGIKRLRSIVHRLRSPGGCPWDAEQTHASLTVNLLEETYEVIDCIKREDWQHLKEELGDLLLQVAFHSEMAQEEGNFTFDEVTHEICEKLIRRHPHVFGNSQAKDAEAVLKQWDEIKRREKGNSKEPFLYGIGKGLPSMLRAVKLQKKASKVGFDWPDDQGVMDKITEELDELNHELKKENAEQISEELGDLLFSVINLARRHNLDPEILLETTNHKFEKRFSKMQESLEEAGINLPNASLKEMEVHWKTAKGDY